MKWAVLAMIAVVLSLAFGASSGMAQPPGGREGNDGRGPGPGPLPNRFELGQVLPPPLIAELNLTAAQELELDAIKKDLKTRLDKLMTDEQKKTIENFRPRGPGGFGGPGGPRGPGGPIGPEVPTAPVAPVAPVAQVGLSWDRFSDDR